MDYLDFYKEYGKGLVKKGQFYTGPCPLCAEKGHSGKDFHVNPSDGFWFCKDCGKGGNTFSFVREKGMSPKEAPDYDPNYHTYPYPGGVLKKKEGKKAFWEGDKGDAPDSSYNPMAMELAKKYDRTLWICEGEQDAEMMLESGELAIGINFDAMEAILDRFDITHFQGISEIIIVFSHDEKRKNATDMIVEQLPFAKVVEWPKDTPEGFDIADLRKVDPAEFIKILKDWIIDKYPYEPLIKHLTEKFDRDVARDPGKLLGYELTEFETLCRNIDGIQPGLYLVAAETGVAKTSFLCNLTLDLLASNKNLLGIFFSFDDTREVILNHFLSVKTGIPLNQVLRPQKLDQHKKRLIKGYHHLTDLALKNRLIVADSTEVDDLDKLEFEVKRRINKKVFVVIDAVHQLDLNENVSSGYRQEAKKANRLKALANKYQIPLICTGVLWKSANERKRDVSPTIFDLEGIENYAFNANLVMMLYPERWEEFESENEPYLILDYVKNKLSYYNGKSFFRFNKITGLLKECEKRIIEDSGEESSRGNDKR